MRFLDTALAGVLIVDIEPRPDERGMFARTFCQREFAAAGLPEIFVQCNVSLSVRKHTLRGLHYQTAPREEGKLVRCIRGVLYDVVVDLRPASRTFRRWIGIELSGETHRAVYVPPGLAHGFVTLTDDTEVFYQMTEFYHPASAAGVRWNDPAFGIEWPVQQPILSERDAAYPDFKG